MVTAPISQVVVGLFTLDNAMQNIALQLKLKLITPSNKLIKQITKYALKCPACCSVYINLEPIIEYRRNKPYLKALLNDDYNPNKLCCPDCANSGLMRVAAYVDGNTIRFSKGKKHFNLKGLNQNVCDVTQKKYASIRNKYLLHPDLYEERMLRVITQNSKKN